MVCDETLNYDVMKTLWLSKDPEAGKDFPSKPRMLDGTIKVPY